MLPIHFLVLFSCSLITASSTARNISEVAKPKIVPGQRGHHLRARKATDHSERCGNTHHIPYLPKGSAVGPLPEEDIPDRCKNSTSLGDHFLVTTTHGAVEDWMLKELSVPFFIYFSGQDNNSTYHWHDGAGFEATGFLRFIAEYYHCLPKIVLFAHPHKTSYHSFRSLVDTVELVQWDNVPGYASMHPHGASWTEYDPSDPVANLGPPLPPELQRPDTPCNQIFNNTEYDYWPSWEYRRAEYISKAYDLFFAKAGMGSLPKKMRMTLVAEFFVRRERILRHPRQFYLQGLKFISDTVKSGAFGSWEVAVVWEMMWHYVFGEPAYLQGLTVEPCVLYRCVDAASQ